MTHLQQLQTNNMTFFSRHWSELEVLRRLKPNDDELSILSFGCSTGEELLGIDALFPRAALFGCDIDWTCLQASRALLRERATIFDASVAQINRHGPYDIVLCNSVLLSHTRMFEGRVRGVDPALWSDTLDLIDSVVKPGGILQIINSNIPFRYHRAFSRYQPIRSNVLFGANFVDMFTPEDEPLCRGVHGFGWSPMLTVHKEASSTELLNPWDLHDTHFWKITDAAAPPPIDGEPQPNRPNAGVVASGTSTYRPDPQAFGAERSTHLEVDVTWNVTAAGSMLIDRVTRRVWFDHSVPIIQPSHHEVHGPSATAMIEAYLGKRPTFVTVKNLQEAAPTRAPLFGL